jgi:hypothetical protein
VSGRTATSAAQRGVQITLIGAAQTAFQQTETGAPNGGTARGYRELSTPLAIPVTVEQAGSRTLRPHGRFPSAEPASMGTKFQHVFSTEGRR